MVFRRYSLPTVSQRLTEGAAEAEARKRQEKEEGYYAHLQQKAQVAQVMAYEQEFSALRSESARRLRDENLALVCH